MNSYDKAYIDAARKKVNAQVSGYKKLAASARDTGDTKVESALTAFEPSFFNNMVLVLENYFVHRTRGIEGKDGNPLNEVRVLANSMMTNGGKLLPDKAIKLTPETSVLGYAVGDDIRLTESDFTQLAKAFFAELEAKFLA